MLNTSPRLTRPSVLWAAGLFAVGLVILLLPVGSTAAYDGKRVADGSSGWELCGVGISQAFVTPHGPADPRAEQRTDCAAKARDRLGWGLLLMLLAVPPAFAAVAAAPGVGRPTDEVVAA